MGGLELSELTVFWKFIDSFSGELLSDSSVRIPFAGLENPAWAGWPHNVRFGSLADINASDEKGPLSEVKPTSDVRFLSPKLCSATNVCFRG